MSSQVAQTRWFAAFCVSLLLICVIVLSTGLCPQRLYAYDAFILFDGGWRIEQGLVPYKDFSMLIGPLPLLLAAGSMAITHESPIAAPLAVVLSLIPLAIAVWIIAIKRLSPSIAFLLAIYLSLLWAGTFPSHFLFYNTSYAMFENRQGYVLISLLLFLLLPVSSSKPSSSFLLTGMGIGLLLALILFEKFNYFISASMLVVGLLNRRITLYSIGIIEGFFVAFVPMAVYLGWDGLRGMVQALQNAGALRSGLVYSESITLILWEIPVLALILFSLLWNLASERSKVKANKASTLNFPTINSLASLTSVFDWYFYEFGVIILVSISLEMGGFPIFSIIDVPLLTAYGIILLSRYNEAALLPSLFDKHILALAAFGLLILLPLLNLALGLLYPLYSLTFDSIEHHVTIASKYCPLTVFDESVGLEKLPEHNEGVLINDGLRLIRKHPELATQKIATLYFTDAFSYCLHQKSPPHMPAFFHVGTNVTKDHYPPPEYIFTDCGAVLVCLTPQNFEFDVANQIPAYSDYLNENFTLTDQSQSWALWERK